MKKLTELDCGKILALSEQRKSIREIEKETGISKSTVGDVIKQYGKKESMGRNIKSGRPSSIGDKELGIIRKIHKKNPKISVPKLNRIFFEKTSIIVSNQTIRNTLNKLGFSSCRPIKRPLLNKKNITSRFGLCKKWSYKSDIFWRSVIFSDECKFNLITSDGIQYVWREPGKRFNSRYTIQTVKYGGGNVMAWGCISYNGVGRLVFIEDTMDKYEYVNILANNLQESVEEMGMNYYIFQHDNDPKHTSMYVKEFFEENEIEVLKWPSQSPDLNPIEHVWSHIKRELAGKNFRNKNELKEELVRLWKNIPKKLLEKLIDSMPKRIRSVLKANGKHTSY
jgi:transposase